MDAKELQDVERLMASRDVAIYASDEDRRDLWLALADTVPGLFNHIKELSSRLESMNESYKLLAVEMSEAIRVRDLQVDVLKRIADAASKVVRGCSRKIVANPGGMCTCDDCTHLSVCLGAYFRPEPEVEKAWFEKRVESAEVCLDVYEDRHRGYSCGKPKGHVGSHCFSEPGFHINWGG